MKRSPDRLRSKLDVTVWTDTPDEDPVVAELPWLRRLARRLAADDADDLVQDTWLMARRYEPVARGRGGLRSWLAQTMRNRRRSHLRSTVARTRREGEVPTPELAPSAERRVIEADVIRVLDEALSGLNDEQRYLLRERFFSERTAADIADELGVPSATVRTKIRRSLMMLRDELDARHGRDRARWASAVVAVPGIRTATGGVTMASAKGIAITAAAAGLVALGVFLWQAKDDEPSVTAEAAVSARAETVAKTVAGDQSRSAATKPDGASDGRSNVEGRRPGSHSESGRSEPSTAHPGLSGDSVTDAAKLAETPKRIRECATAPMEHDCDFLDPSAPVIDEMARCGVVRYDFPAMFLEHDWTPKFEAEWLELVGATDAEHELIVGLARTQREALFAGLAELGREVGVGPWDGDATLLDAVVELNVAVGDDAMVVASRIYAEELAGKREPPESLEGRPLAERFLRHFAGVGDGFEAALAEELGPQRARELHLAQDGWPGIRSHTGARCPE